MSGYTVLSDLLAVTDSGRNAQFVKCDTTFWTDQLYMFKQAVANSPDKSCDVVIANAGVSGADELFALEGWTLSIRLVM
jgi:alpha-D-ribose 1-methylphosphonate 5-triphosphate synthase subunit PhnH